MKKAKIWAGQEINTPEGYAVIKGYNGSIVDLEEFADDGNSEPRFLTLAEIGHIMQETDKDGQTYKVSFLSSDLMSYTDTDFKDVLKGEYKIFCSNYEDADIQSFIDYLGWQDWMEEYVCSQGYEEFDETSDIQCALIDEYIRKVLS